MDEQLKVRRAAAKERARERYHAELSRRQASGEIGTADELDAAISVRRGRRAMRKAASKANNRLINDELLFNSRIPCSNKGLRKRKVKYKYPNGVPEWDRIHT